jgi:hypothetical protein
LLLTLAWIQLKNLEFSCAPPITVAERDISTL